MNSKGARSWLLFAFGTMIVVTSLITSRTCMPIRSVSATSGQPFRPPPWVFGVVWPILYVTTGMAWQRAPTRVYGYFLGITALCCLWLVLYSCLQSRRLAAVVLVLSAVLAWRLFVLLRKPARDLMLPLSIWLSFASYLSIASLAPLTHDPRNSHTALQGRDVMKPTGSTVSITAVPY